MATSVAAQDTCPTRADLKQGLALIAEEPGASLLFGESSTGVSVRPYNPEVYNAGFDGIPDGYGVSSPHAIIPGHFDGPKGPATIVYYTDQFVSEGSSDFDDLFEINALLDQVLSDIPISGVQSFDAIVDFGTWKMMGLALWNQRDGVLNVESRGPSGAHQLGRCSYDIMTFRLRLDLGRDASLFEDRHYAPALGLVIGTTPLAPDGTASGTRWFRDILRYDFAPGTRCDWEAKQGRDC